MSEFVNCIKPENEASKIDESLLKYQLYGIVAHTGKEAGFGHYTATLRCLFDMSSYDESNEKMYSEANGSTNKEVNAEVNPEGNPNEQKENEKMKNTKNFFDQWFQFNDANVKPVDTSQITNLFCGQTSAYMLLYRAGPIQPIPLPHVPSHFKFKRELTHLPFTYDPFQISHDARVSHGPLEWRIVVLFSDAVSKSKSGAATIAFDPQPLSRYETSQVYGKNLLCCSY
jgi:hypothetical protein